MIGAGLAGQLGAKKETVYGTPVTVDKFFPFTSEGLGGGWQRNRQYSIGIQAGQLVQHSARVATTTRGGGGPVKMDVPIKGFGFWPDLMVGGTVTPVLVLGTAYKSTFNIGASDSTKSASVQVGKPRIDGTVQAFSYEGCVPMGFSLSQGVDGFLETEIALDVQDRLTGTALAVASYPTANDSFHFGHCTPTINSVPVTDVFSSVKVDVNFARKTDRWRLGSAGAKAIPVTNGFTDGTIEFEGDFKDLTFTNLYDADTIFPVILNWTHTTNADVGGTKYSFVLTAQACQMTGDDPDLAGPDVLSQGFKCKILNDQTNPPLKLEIVSIDSLAW